jgi:hypothetical protein
VVPDGLARRRAEVGATTDGVGVAASNAGVAAIAKDASAATAVAGRSVGGIAMAYAAGRGTVIRWARRTMEGSAQRVGCSCRVSLVACLLDVDDASDRAMDIRLGALSKLNTGFLERARILAAGDWRVRVMVVRVL